MGSLVAAPSHYLQEGVMKKLLWTKNPRILVPSCLNSLSVPYRNRKARFLRNSLIDSVMGQALFRSYGRLFAEFLDEESLVHLGLLDLSTCVGLRYG